MNLELEKYYEIICNCNYINWLNSFIKGEDYISSEKNWHKGNDYLLPDDKSNLNKLLYFYDLVVNYYQENSLLPSDNDIYLVEYLNKIFSFANHEYYFECFITNHHCSCPNFYELQDFYLDKSHYQNLKLVKINNIYKK